VKVFAIIAFIVIGGLAIIGVIPMADGSPAPGLGGLTRDGVFPNGFGAVLTTMLTVNFAFSGTELIGVAAGETADPHRNIPRAIRTTLVRLTVFFIGSILVLAALIPWQEAGVEDSPFVTVLDMIGVPNAGDLMNVVVVTAILSAANSGLSASTRMLWSLANEGTVPAVVARTTRRGVPVVALSLSMVGGLLALLSSVIAPGTVYLALVSISGLAVVIVWMAIAACQFVFRRRWLEAGHSAAELGYRTPGYPWVPLAAFIGSAASCILIVFDPDQASALYWTVPFVALCYAGHALALRRGWVRA